MSQKNADKGRKMPRQRTPTVLRHERLSPALRPIGKAHSSAERSWAHGLSPRRREPRIASEYGRYQSRSKLAAHPISATRIHRRDPSA
jgi:hypothetical protein